MKLKRWADIFKLTPNLLRATKRKVIKNNVDMSITKKEFEVLSILVEEFHNENKFCSKNILFKKIYGPITLHYTVYKNRNVVLLTDLTPSEILIEGHKKELNTYKGTIVATEKDLFKAKIFSIMEEK